MHDLDSQQLQCFWSMCLSGTGPKRTEVCFGQKRHVAIVGPGVLCGATERRGATVCRRPRPRRRRGTGRGQRLRVGRRRPLAWLKLEVVHDLPIPRHGDDAVKVEELCTDVLEAERSACLETAFIILVQKLAEADFKVTGSRSSTLAKFFKP